MAEPRGRAARWSAAALAAPVAAGLFAGTSAWAQHHDPLHPSKATAATPAPKLAPAPDPALVALRQALLANARTVERLSKQVAAVRAQAAALAATGRAAPSAGRSGSGWAGSGAATGSAGTSRTGGSQPPVVVTIPAPPPPPTQTTTGASGAPK